jgi:hypothetical protein
MPGDAAASQDSQASDAAAADKPAAEPSAKTGPQAISKKATPEELARRAFEPPPGGKSLSKTARLWVDRQRRRVYVDGYVALKRGPLEMFACPVGTKEHESIVAALARSKEVHAALLAVEANPGTPVRFDPDFSPPTGQVIRIYVCWYDADGKFHSADARQWIEDIKTQEQMTAEWVFAGSGFWQDPEDKREYYLADSGDMICVSNFSSAMLDVTIESSDDAGALRFQPFEEKIPELFTPVRLVMVPVPDPGEQADRETLLQLPEQNVLPRADQQ